MLLPLAVPIHSTELIIVTWTMICAFAHGAPIPTGRMGEMNEKRNIIAGTKRMPPAVASSSRVMSHRDSGQIYTIELSKST